MFDRKKFQLYKCNGVIFSYSCENIKNDSNGFLSVCLSLFIVFFIKWVFSLFIFYLFGLSQGIYITACKINEYWKKWQASRVFQLLVFSSWFMKLLKEFCQLLKHKCGNRFPQKKKVEFEVNDVTYN